MLDILSKTIMFFVFSVAFLFYSDVWTLGFFWLISLLVALSIKNARSFVLIVIFIPLMPIGISHFIIEPLFLNGIARYTIEINQFRDAALGYFRVSGLSLLSISWLWSSSFNEMSSLSRIIPYGRQIIVSINIVITLILIVRQRWEAVQLIHQFHQNGSWKARRKIKLRQIPKLGLSLLISVLASLDDYSCIAKSKAFLNNNALATPYPKFSFIGLMCVIASVSTIIIINNFIHA